MFFHHLTARVFDEAEGVLLPPGMIYSIHFKSLSDRQVGWISHRHIVMSCNCTESCAKLLPFTNHECDNITDHNDHHNDI